MMSCNCLNVIIESEGNGFQKVQLESLGLSEIERKDNFFQQELLQAEKLFKITKKVSGLVTSRLVGSWIVHHCINCNTHTHASHQDRGSLVLVSANLLTASKISALTKSEQYSNVFNLIVNDYDPLDETSTYDYLSAEVELNINSLRQKVNEVINRESAATEERIRQFTEQQHLALEEFRDKVLKDHKALRRIILNHKLNSSRSSDTNTNFVMNSPVNMKSPVKSIPDEFSPIKSVALSKTKQNSNTPSPNSKHIKTTPRPSYHNSMSQDSSFDSEGLFQLDEMEDFTSYVESDSEVSDNEDSMREDKSEYVQRGQKNYSNNLAKSLPMNIPAFMSAFQNHSNEDSDDNLEHTEDPMDIAASIKALAKSVHGDAIFGDLPRPRFSTQI